MYPAPSVEHSSHPRMARSFALVLVLFAAMPLASQESPFGLLDDHASAILLVDPESGAILDANRSAVEFYGYPHGRLLSLNITDLNALSPEDVARERERALREERSYFIFPHRLADGCVRTVEVYSSPVTSAAYDRPLLLSIIHDISGKRVADADLADYTNTVNLLIERRARELSTARLLAVGVSGLTLMLIVAGVSLIGSLRFQRRASAALEKALEDKTLLFKELQHRVRIPWLPSRLSYP